MKKVLWVSNNIFPDLSKKLGSDIPVAGGWMYGLANDLSNHINLTVATVRENQPEYNCTINGINYYLLNAKVNKIKYDEVLEEQWKKIADGINPDLVHIHGTEYAHGLALMKACPKLNYVISIQGMTSVIGRYYNSGISMMEILKNITLRDILKSQTIFQEKRKFEKRGSDIELNYIKLATDIIGRTQWDHDHVKTINPTVNYHFCNESLRDSFYNSKKWNTETKKDYTVFLTQASYPIKGLHKVLEAVNYIKDEFPQLKIRVAKKNILHNHKGFLEKMKIGGYGKYIRSLIKKYKLQNSVEFIGYKDEEAMVEEYLNAHVFICPSSIENSPNSLGEAQILGVPCIAAYVGGIPEMVTDGETGKLYRFEEVEMLAQAIKKIFTNDSFSEKLSKNSIQVASERHHRKTNLNKTLSIYDDILSSQQTTEDNLANEN